MMNFIKDYWYGRMPLRNAFWGFGIFIPHVLAPSLLLLLSLTDVVSLKEDPSPILVEILIVSLLIYFVFAYVSIWRCAKNAKPIWTNLAKVFVVLSTALIIYNELDYYLTGAQQ